VSSGQITSALQALATRSPQHRAERDAARAFLASARSEAERAVKAAVGAFRGARDSVAQMDAMARDRRREARVRSLLEERQKRENVRVFGHWTGVP
jgi:hypothetical protein